MKLVTVTGDCEPEGAEEETGAEEDGDCEVGGLTVGGGERVEEASEVNVDNGEDCGETGVGEAVVGTEGGVPEDEEEDGRRAVEEIEGCVEVGVVAEGVVVDDGVVEDDGAVLVDNVTCDEEDEG